MNGFIYMLCAGEAAETQTPSLQSVILEYVFYAAIIIVGILILALLKKKTRLPTHNELKRRLNVLAESLDRIIASLDKEEGGYDFLREINKLIYAADKLIYAVTLVSERERDTGISSIAQQLETCKNKLAPYKYRTKAKNEADGLKDARADLNAALLAMDSILGRDNELKEKKAKRYNG